MYLCQPLDLLHNLRNSKLMGTLLYAGHTGTASAGRRALFYSQIELSEGPVILSQKKVVILPENRMNFRSMRAGTPLAPVAGNRLVTLPQDGEHPLKIGAFRDRIPGCCCVYLFHCPESDQGAGNRISKNPFNCLLYTSDAADD